MATAQANQKVYVSPGVYTSETDLSFVAQSVGVTTLGLVGETIKGPAFEPVFITNYDEFQAYFGGTEPVKFVNTQIPKYEAAYIAKSYLQQSNQLFVTRILGLSGYDAGPSWSITTVANVDATTIGLSGSTAPFSNTFTATTGTITTWDSFPTEVQTDFNTQYVLSNGSTSSYNASLDNYIQQVLQTNSLSATSSYFYGSVPTADYDDITTTYSETNNAFGVYNLSLDYNDLSSSENDSWYYATFNPGANDSYAGYSWDFYIDNFGTAGTGTFTGSVIGNLYTFSGTAYPEYNDMVVATLRSRGISL